MIVKVTIAIHSLKRLSCWIATLPESKRGHEATENRVEDIVVGCFDLMEYSPTTNLVGWLAHRPRRKQLRNPAKAVWHKSGRKAIQELITLTISELEACLPFQPTVVAGVLPMTMPPARTKEHLQALNRGRDRYHDQQQRNTIGRRERSAEWRLNRTL